MSGFNPKKKEAKDKSMKKIIIFIILFISIFAIDQEIKNFIIDGFRYDTKCISITYTLNNGVAFSMFAFLGEYLKYIQIFLIVIVAFYVVKSGYFKDYYIPTAILLSGAISNVLDRFVYGGVVDYVAWHCYFDFAIFNFADVMIDLSIALIIYINYTKSKHLSG